MKFLVVFAVITIAVAVNGLTTEQKERLRQLGRECSEKSGVPKDILVKAKNGELSDDSRLKAFTTCMFKRLGFQSETGEIQVDVIRNKLPADLTDAEKDNIIDTCAGLTGDTDDETAYKVYKCYLGVSATNHASLV